MLSAVGLGATQLPASAAHTQALGVDNLLPVPERVCAAEPSPSCLWLHGGGISPRASLIL